MDRREFLSFSSLLTASLSGQPASLISSLPGVGEGKMGIPAAGQVQTKVPVHTHITSEFMEEYTPGKPWQSNLQFDIPLQTPYTARDGSQQFFTFANWQIFKKIARLYPSADSLTGWDVQLIDVPAEQTRGGQQDTPTAVIVPGVNGSPDTLLLYRTNSIMVGPLANDGTLTLQTASPFGRQRSRMYQTGQLRAGTRYQLEHTLSPEINNGVAPPISLAPTSTAKRGYILRDLTRPVYNYSIDFHALSYPDADYTIKAFYPLLDSSDNIYRCVLLTDRNDIFYISLKRDDSDPNAPVFKLLERQLLGHSAMGLMYVQQEAVGEFKVFILDTLPKGKVVTAQYPDRGLGPLTSDIPWDAKTGFTLPQFDSRILQPNREWRLIGTPNPYSKTTEIFLVERDTTRSDGWVDLWTTTRNTDGTWEPLAQVDRQCATVDVYPSTSMTLLISKPATGFEVLTRGENGEWESDLIRVPTDDNSMTQIAGYRVGIEVFANGVPKGGERVDFLVTAATPALIGDKHVALSVHRPTRVIADSNGIAWITVLLQDRLNFPGLMIILPRLSMNLQIDLNHKVEDFFTNISEDELRNAKDPVTKAPALQPKGDLGNAINNIHSLMNHEKEQRHAWLEDFPGSEHKLTSDLPARWIPTSAVLDRNGRFDASLLAPRIRFNDDHCWSLDLADGCPVHRKLTREEAHLEMASLRVAHPPMPAYFGFFDDVFDALASVANAVWDGVVQVTNVVFEGASFILRVVVDGLSFIIDGVLDTIERVMDVVAILLDSVGFILGMAVNWVLEQLGFLFDWGKIKQRRTDMKQFLFDNAGILTRHIPDPAIGAKKFADAVEDMRRWLMQFRSTQASTGSYGGTLGGMPALPDIFSLNGVSAMPQSTWLMDKVKDRLFKYVNGPAAPTVTGLADAQAVAVNKMIATASTLPLSLDDLLTLVTAWSRDTDIFSTSAFQPLLDLVLSKLDAFIQLVKDVAIAVGDVLHKLWLHPEAILHWMDAELPIPFVNGFYRGLTGNNLSMLDVLCLTGSIISVATGQDLFNGSRALAAPAYHPFQTVEFELGPGRYLAHPAHQERVAWMKRYAAYQANGNQTAKDAGGVALLFMAITTFSAALDAGFIAMGRKKTSEDDENNQLANGTGKFNLAANLINGVCLAIVAAESGSVNETDRQMEIAIPIVLGLGLVTAFVICPRLDSKLWDVKNTEKYKAGLSRAVLGDLLSNALNIYFLVRAIQNGTDKDKARSTLALTQSLLVMGTRAYAEIRGPVPGFGPFYIGAIVGSLNAARFGIYFAEYLHG